MEQVQGQEITVIFVKADWCGHCKNFTKIYDEAIKLYKLNNFLNNYNVNFEVYDIENNDRKNILSINHYEIIDKISGYPTIFIKSTNKLDKTRNIYDQIDHTVINSEININNQKNEAANRFILNIVNYLKTLESDNTSLFIQQGGTTNTKNEVYRNKYLKYKSKYLELKKNYYLII